MKTLLFSLLISALLILGCNEKTNVPTEPKSNSYTLIKLPPKSGLSVETIFSETKLINGNVGGDIELKRTYFTSNGGEVKIDCKLDIPQGCFSGEALITFTIDDQYAAASFSPHMVFNNPVKLQIKFDGLDPEELELVSGEYDFLYFDDNGNTETVEHDGVFVDESGGQITLGQAYLNHFSRYGWVR